MDSIIITPKVGIGPFKLGMSEYEVKETFNAHDHWRRTNNAYNHSILEELFIKFEYDSNNTVKFIEMVNPSYAGVFHIPCLYNGIDVFTTKASDLVSEINKETSYNRDSESEMGFMYVFPELQLAFWRENVITEDLMNSEDFLQMSQENQELEKRYFYFTTVSIAVPGYR
ncbi:hypothetical protein [Paenibacillus sp. PL91]|uniref:hypothetical protein n=1 Tax=Paenibacillus sp. PL91 TaxID=2729538 RepID=UPI00145CB8B7|nr:hypothetical protein [Paenibacillus sp. PL91]MBC9202480.1 hypothetical protein [Paenibacillus sp. PL91]